MIRILFYLGIVAISFECIAIEVTDDSGKLIKIEKPAQRVITLAPHLTEIMYAINEGNKIVATISYSDYPEQARQIPRLGSYENVKLESILAYQPDLILAWDSGNNLDQLAALERFGLIVYRDHPKTIQDVAKTLRKIGILTGSQTSNKVVSEFLEKLNNLKHKYKDRKHISVFYQFWDNPIYTINGQHFINDVLNLCGLDNVFSDLSQISATVNREAIIKANPDVIIAAGMGGVHTDWIEKWKKWPEITAVKLNNLFTINPDLLHRHTTRMLIAAKQICLYADQARNKLR